MRKLFFVAVFFLSIVLLNSKYFEIEYSYLDRGVNDSLIGLTVDGNITTDFPRKEDGLAIDSIVCDKEANGVWDYRNWLLKVRNVTENRTKCQVNFVRKYTESILNGADPVLKDGMIPVLISDEGVVTKASEGWEWYKYEGKHQWANAVILYPEDERANPGKEYYDGDIIEEGDIESYFVWIPRYKYRIFDMGNYEKMTSIANNKPDIIDVQFGTGTTINEGNECKTPNKSGNSGYCSVGKYMTHPAFTSFDEEGKITKGIWVGKFETGYKGATSTTGAEINVVENGSEKIQIKPNVYSWRNIQVANAYLSSYSYKREYDSHLMKNTEWGAVAYLQHSAYGSGNVSVRINNNSAMLTGYGATKEPTCGYTGDSRDCNKYGTTSDITQSWITDSGRAASTTKNMYGVYDMSGGAWEYVMGVMLNSDNTRLCSGGNATSNSGFNGPYCNIGQTGAKADGVDFPSDTRYYDAYTYSSISQELFTRRILGDATGEMGPFQLNNTMGGRPFSSWYNDEAWMVFSTQPWYFRGSASHIGNGAGIFEFGNRDGSAIISVSFRVVLTI